MTPGSAILLKSAIATVLSIAASLAVVSTIVPAIGGVVDGNAWLMTVLCPLMVAWPASAWQFWQAERLRRARDELASLHGRLAEAHGALEEAHGALTETARRDELTGLFGRRAFFEAAEARRTAGGGWLMVLDVDRFKAINDRFGHAAGDLALRQVAGRIADAAPADAALGRIGGEEFAILLPAADEDEAARVAEAVRAAVAAEPLRVDDAVGLTLTVSAGMVRLDADGALKDAFKAADDLLYEAKRAGRDMVRIDERAAPTAPPLAPEAPLAQEEPA
ncbi:MAG: GGDEF domain-containing protein [Ancylobacter novellus]|uniref:diguanylate cyclase n=1 Tax=Ancylobacter novellus TaxID=921 RepID=A0A2W5MFC7_ANCNO|nr:MAG: GGDEF domain-containing protein [Ancylobacter novellus]